MVRSPMQKRLASALLLLTVAVQLNVSGAWSALQSIPAFMPFIGVQQVDAQSNGNFVVENADPKYGKTWIVQITCRNAAGQNVTHNQGGNSHTLAALVRTGIVAKGLALTQPQQAIVRSDGGTGAGFNWNENSGTIHMPTVTAVCQILGNMSDTYVSSTCRDTERSGIYPNGKCNFHSPGDNNMHRFTGTLASAACQDGVDNDNDGRIDFPADPGCSSATDTTENGEAACQDNIDNDGDGLKDFPLDPGCVNAQDNDEFNAPTPQCRDGIDNDGDGRVDFPADPGCSNQDDTTEGGDPACADRVDNDGDGLVDYPQDPGCSSLQDTDEFNQVQCPATRVTANFEGRQGPWEDVAPSGDATPPTFVSNVQAGGTVKVISANGSYSARIYGGQDQLPLTCDKGTLSFTNNSNQTLSKVRLDSALGGVTVPNGATRAYLSHDEPGSYNYFDNSGNRDRRSPCVVTLDVTPNSCQQMQCSDGVDNDGDGLVDFPQDPGCVNAQDNDESPRNIGNLDVEKVLNGTITPGQNASYTITVRNTGNVAAQNVNVYDYFLDSQDLKHVPFTFVSSTGVTCSYQSGAQQVSCPVGTVSPNQTVTMTLTFAVPPNQACSTQIRNRVDAWINGQQAGADVDDVSSNVQCLAQCRNGIDDDGDGRIDFPADPGCSNQDDNTEGGDPACADRVDNDGDGLVDFPQDPGCVNLQDNDEFNAVNVDLSLQKTGPASVVRGQSISYTLTVQNASQVQATNVVVTDQIPAGLTYNDILSYSSCAQQGSNVVCNLGTINAGQNGTFTITFDTPAIANCTNPVNVVNTATISSTQTDSNQANNTATTQLNPTRIDCPVVPQCQDGIDNDGDGATDFPNDFSCSSPTDTDETNPKAACQDGVDNDGDGLVDFPQDPGCVSRQDNDEFNQVQCTANTLTAYFQGNQGPWDDNPSYGDAKPPSFLGAVEPGTNFKFVSAPGYFSARLRNGNDEIPLPCSYGVITFTNNALQTLSKQMLINIGANGFTAPAGTTKAWLSFDESDPGEYYDNSGNRDSRAACQVTLSVTPVSCTAARCSNGMDDDGDGLIDFPADPGCVNAQDNDEYNVPTPQCRDGIDNDGDGRVDFPADPGCSNQDDTTEGGDPACADRVDNDGDGLIDFPQDPGCVNLQDTDEFNQVQTIDLATMKTGPASVIRGQPILYTLTVRNNGQVQATNLVVTDPIPAGLTYNDGLSHSTCSQQNNAVVCTHPSLGVGQTGTFTVAFDTPTLPNCTAPVTVINSFSVTAAQQDNNMANNTTSTVANPTRVDCPTPQPQCRDGIDNDFDGRVDMLDPGCQNPDDNNEGDDPACSDRVDNDNDGLIDFPFDPGCASPTDTDEFNQVQTVDITIQKAGPQTVVRGQTLFYSILVGNSGTTQATNVVVSDTVPAGLVYNDALSYGPCALSGNVVSCTLGSLSTNQFGSFYIAFDTPAVQNCSQVTVTNVATISGTQTDSNPSNNTSSTQASPTRIDCPTPLAQCQDFNDNDFDGRIDFPADPGCSSPTDNNENDEAACQDGRDNDNDGRVDFPQDPGCTGPTDTDETDPVTPPQCRDGIDNDNDGRVDMLDPGCSNPDDTNEGDDPACSDRLDNDNDGLIDFPQDPGCASPADTDEFNAPNTQCRDGIDNDNDGKVDFPADPGCSSATDTDETDVAQFGCVEIKKETFDPHGNPLPIAAQFTFILDATRVAYNDASGRARFDNLTAGAHSVAEIIPSGWTQLSVSPQNGMVTVTPGTTCAQVTFRNRQVFVANAQCADGYDNDGDGATDYPQDQGCSSATDNDEYNSTFVPQCSDNVDNDGDGLKDYPQDTGCENAADNNEQNAGAPITYACSDNVDNDGDGLKDYPLDPGCSSATDTDEANVAGGTFACNDGVDNDNDGLKDYPQDTGCTSAQDTDEFNFRAARCSDGIDNDGDGLKDYPQDTGCTTPYDDNEYNDRLWLDRWREFWNWNW